VSTVGAMEHEVVSALVVIESCPTCRSVDVRTLEPRWFTVQVDRRDELHEDSPGTSRPARDDGLAVEVRFGCRDCGTCWD